ncbi:MAG: GlsB/YeaQ/YmgE family stress response membrane protein [Hyphomicrobiales bacterium]|nr:GlsB/YeaQ/YmgE family stress response membrane protein [Hyphomicrobiales bacterium]
MYMSHQSILITLVIGIIAGWLASKVVHGSGSGLIGDLVIGILGAFIGGWLLPKLGIFLGFGFIPAVINATIGAVILLIIIRLVRGNDGSARGR